MQLRASVRQDSVTPVGQRPGLPAWTCLPTTYSNRDASKQASWTLPAPSNSPSRSALIIQPHGQQPRGIQQVNPLAQPHPLERLGHTRPRGTLTGSAVVVVVGVGVWGGVVSERIGGSNPPPSLPCSTHNSSSSSSS